MKKMKRIFAFALACVMLFPLTSCGEPKVETLIDKYSVSDTLGIQYPLGSAFDEFDGYYGVTETGASIINDVDCYGSLRYDFMSKEGNAEEQRNRNGSGIAGTVQQRGDPAEKDNCPDVCIRCGQPDKRTECGKKHAGYHWI